MMTHSRLATDLRHKQCAESIKSQDSRINPGSFLRSTLKDVYCYPSMSKKAEKVREPVRLRQGWRSRREGEATSWERMVCLCSSCTSGSMNPAFCRVQCTCKERRSQREAVSRED